MGNSLRDEVKDAIRSIIADLLEGYSLGELSFRDIIDGAAADISDRVFEILLAAPEIPSHIQSFWRQKDEEEQGAEEC